MMEDEIFIDESERFVNYSSAARGKYNFPTVRFKTIYVGGRKAIRVCFNPLATSFLRDTERVSIKVSKNFIVFSPQKCGNTSKVSRVSGSATISASKLDGIIPTDVEFRAYPYKGGIVIKRFEPLREDKA